MGTQATGEYGIRWARVLAALLVIALAGEGVSRLAVQLRTGRPFQSLDAYVFSGYGSFRQNPAYTHREFVHNSAGFRNLRDFSVEKPPRTLRIMGIGASVLYAGSAPVMGGVSRRVATEDTITAYLEPLLREMPALADYELEVINASTNRHQFRDVLSYYAAELARYDPDIVLIFGTNNDGRWLEYEGALSVIFYDPENPSREQLLLERLANEASIPAVGEKLLRVAAQGSALAALAYRAVDALLQRTNVAMKRALGRGGRMKQRRIAGEAERARSLRAYLAGLGALTTLVELHGAKPFVFWEYLLMTIAEQKPLSDYEGRVLEFVNRRTGAFSAEERRLKLETRDAVAAFLLERGVPMIDLLDALRGYDGTVFNDYLHYTPEGNRWVAERIAERLRPQLAAWAARQAQERS